jgi:hypothetical protein
MLIEGENEIHLQEAIKAAFPPEQTARVPYLFDLVTDPGKAITYVYKAVFNRRSAYKKHGKSRTLMQSLKGPDERRLLRFLDKFPIGTRLILRGVRRNGRRLVGA